MSREVLADAFEDLARRAPRVDAGAFAESAVHGARRARGRALLAGPALAVVLLLALFSAVTVLPRPAPASGPGEPAPAAVLPARVVEYLPWTPLLGKGEPLGRAVLVVEQSEGYFVIGLDGSARRLPTVEGGFAVTSPVLSPDGTKLAYGWSAPEDMSELDPHEAASSALRLVDLVTGETRTLERGKVGRSIRYRSLAWAPDARRLAAVTIEGADAGNGRWGTVRRIAVLDGGAKVWSVRAPFTAEIAWSPDGTRLATGWTGGVVVKLWSADDGAPGAELKVEPQADLDNAAWGPDGRNLYLLREDGRTSYQSDPPVTRWVPTEVPVDADRRRRERRVGDAVNPWVVGWRHGRPVVELPNLKGVAELVVLGPNGPRHLVALEGKSRGSQPSVASELLAVAPVRDVAPRKASVWSADGLRWVVGPFVVVPVLLVLLGAVAYFGSHSTGRGIRRTRRPA